MSDSYEPTSLSQALYAANRQLVRAKTMTARAQEIEAYALLRIKQLESKLEFQRVEDREYVSRRIKTYAGVAAASIALSKGQIRKYKKAIKEIK